MKFSVKLVRTCYWPKQCSLPLLNIRWSLNKFKVLEQIQGGWVEKQPSAESSTLNPHVIILDNICYFALHYNCLPSSASSLQKIWLLLLINVLEVDSFDLSSTWMFLYSGRHFKHMLNVTDAKVCMAYHSWCLQSAPITAAQPLVATEQQQHWSLRAGSELSAN